MPGASAYGGYRGAGSPGFVEEALDGGAQFALLMDGPTMNLKVDAGVEAAALVEVGLAALNPQIGIDAGGAPTGATLRVGTQLYSAASKPTNNANGVGSGGVPYLGMVLISLAPPTAPDGCVSDPTLLLEGLGLALTDPMLGRAVGPAGLQLFTDGDSADVAGAEQANMDFDGDGTPDDGVYNSNMIPLLATPTLVGVALSWQVLTVNALTSEARGSQVWTAVFRATT